MNNNGKVYIVGVGPGDYKLITLKALECIKKADVIVYDRLIGSRILSFAREDAKKVYVGKLPDCHAVPQDEINRLMLEYAKKGKTVARVKGGDPFVFGRGGEEALFLRESGIDFQVVPGVTSAIAVPAYAGIPVTHRDYCSSLHIITGHERPDKEESSIDYRELVGAGGTLVFLMGVKNLSGIAQNLIKHGMEGSTPAAVIERGTTFDQRVIKGTLMDIADKAKSASVHSPAVTIVGRVVGLQEDLDWFLKGRLAGKRIVVTRAREQASRLVEMIEELGGEAIEFPTVRIESPADFSEFDKALEDIKGYDWIVFTSINGVKAFFQRLRKKEIDIRTLYGIRISAVGQATKEELGKLGLNVDYMPEKFTTSELLKGMLDVVRPGERILLARSDIADKELSEGLIRNGNKVDDIAVYKTCPVLHDREELLNMFGEGRIDFITFTSSSTVVNFINAVGLENIDKISSSRIVCIGPVTARTAIESGLKVAAVADRHTIDGLLDKLIEIC